MVNRVCVMAVCGFKVWISGFLFDLDILCCGLAGSFAACNVGRCGINIIIVSVSFSVGVAPTGTSSELWPLRKRGLGWSGYHVFVMMLASCS